MAPPTLGADFTTTLPFAKDLQEVALESGSEPDDGIPLVLWVGVIQSARRVRAAMSPETAGTQRADRDGVSVTPPHANTEGPRHGTSCWVAVEGVSERSERGRASDEGPCTRVAT